VPVASDRRPPTVALGAELTAAPYTLVWDSTTTFDGFIDVSLNNFSATMRLKAFTRPDKQIANAILLKFDLSAISARVVIHDATFHQRDAARTATYAVTVDTIVGKDPGISGATGYTADALTDCTERPRLRQRAARAGQHLRVT
jgi:hypothetical protein